MSGRFHQLLRGIHLPHAAEIDGDDAEVGIFLRNATDQPDIAGAIVHGGRKRATGARAEGRLSHAEKRPEVVMLAKKLRRKLPKGGQKSYSEIAAELFALGHANSNGVAFSKSSIKSMLEG